MSQTVLDLIIIAAMAGVFVIGLWRKVPIGLIMVIASVAALLIGGFGLSFRHITEGSLYFLVLMSQIVMGMFFIKVMEHTGALDAIGKWAVAAFAKSPLLLLAVLAVFVMFPAMVTGSTPVSVLTTGVVAGMILVRIGVPKIEAGAIIAIAALAGQSAPPVNVLVMIICTSTFMPYQGFGLPLALATFPQAILSAWYFGLRHVKRDALKLLVDEDRKNGVLIEKPWPVIRLFLPIITLTVLMILPRVFPKVIPDPNTPFMFLIAALVAMVTGLKKINFVAVSHDTIKNALTVLILFVGMGVIVQVMGVTGVSGLLATTIIALPVWALYISTVVGSIGLGGPVVPFGVSAIIGPPIVLAFGSSNSVIVTAAVSLLLSLGCLIPPSALSSLFAGEILGVKNYMQITRRAWAPALLTIAVSVLMIYFANPIGKFLGV